MAKTCKADIVFYSILTKGVIDRLQADFLIFRAC